VKKTGILYVYGGPEFHPTEWAGKQLTAFLKADGRFELEMTTDLDAFAALPDGRYAAVVLYTTGFKDDLTPAREKGLLQFVKNGGGFVGIHSAADSFRGSRPYVEMLGGEFLTHPHHHEFPVNIITKNHYMTVRMPDSYTAFDEMYHLQNHDPSTVTLLAQTSWQGEQKPMAYAKDYGKGKVVYLAPGHTTQAWNHPEFRKLLIRAIAWTTGATQKNKSIQCGLLGYGPSFGMGKGHAEWISSINGLRTVAMCDTVSARVEAAKQELPGLKGYFTRLEDMLALKDLDLVVNILPHNLHAATTMQCLKAGKHVVLEKPFCITTAEANAMIARARRKKLMLSLFHNRRWDGDYLTIKDIIRRGLIGAIFHIECGIMSYAHPRFWWRSDKKMSGGIMYDWGAHFIDWILNLVPDAKMVQVTGDFQKRVWHSVTNEDHGQAWIRFDNGVTADFMVSSIAANTRPKWRILGTAGAIEADWKTIKLTSHAAGVKQESEIEVTLPSYGTTEYYRTVADHLLMGEELAVTPEQARRVIAVVETAEKSSQAGRSLPVPEGCE